MPIQPMGVNSYSQIPDEEDVTPIDGSIAKKAQRSFKLVAFIVFLFLVVIVALVGLWEYDLAVRGVEVYQTSMSSSEGLLRIGTADFNKMDAKVRKVDFGNTRCKSTACTNMPSNTAKLVVDSKKPFQEILGFGGAFTEAVAHNFYQLPSEVQEKIIQMYFGEDGIGYSIGRIHINSCDFSLKSYSFDDIAGDYKLEYFDKEVTHDNAYIIPLILSAAAASKNPLKILASPWSPPAWMKVPVDGVQSMTGSAWPNGLLADSRTQETWARYISKFITAYKEKGIGIWALTPQNEPEFAAPW